MCVREKENQPWFFGIRNLDACIAVCIQGYMVWPHISEIRNPSHSSLTSGTQRQRHGFPPFPRFLVIRSFSPITLFGPSSPASARRRRHRRRLSHAAAPRSLADSSQARGSVHPRARQGRWRTRCTAPALSDPGKPYRTTSAASRSILCTPRNWIGSSDGC